MTHIVIPAQGKPWLTKAAVAAVRRTMRTESYSIAVIDGLAADRDAWPTQGPRNHAAKLEWARRHCPESADLFFVMHSDAVPLCGGWLAWLRKRFRSGDAWARFGTSMNVGSLYDITWLQHTPRTFDCAPNPGDQYRDLPGTQVPRNYEHLPWWLRNCEAYRDDAGNLVFAHLGGGTIGHTWYKRNRPALHRLNLRIPARLWPYLTRRWLIPYTSEAEHEKIAGAIRARA